MRHTKNEYNELNLATFRKLAELAFAIERIEPRDTAARVYRLARLGPNGLVRVHLRNLVFFQGKNAIVKDLLAQMLTLADDFSTVSTPGGLETILNFGVGNIVTNFDENDPDDGGECYRSLGEIDRA